MLESGPLFETTLGKLLPTALTVTLFYKPLISSTFLRSCLLSPRAVTINVSDLG